MRVTAAWKDAMAHAALDAGHDSASAFVVDEMARRIGRPDLTKIGELEKRITELKRQSRKKRGQ